MMLNKVMRNFDSMKHICVVAVGLCSLLGIIKQNSDTLTDYHLLGSVCMIMTESHCMCKARCSRTKNRGERTCSQSHRSDGIPSWRQYVKVWSIGSRFSYVLVNAELR